jgi:hypothetical protein
MDVNLSQEKVLSMIGEREVRISLLQGQVIQAGQEIARLNTLLKKCTCGAKEPVAVPPPADPPVSIQ